MAKYMGEKVENRFEKIYGQGTLTPAEIWVDKETGVQYLLICGGSAGGLTPLLAKDGKPLLFDPYK